MIMAMARTTTISSSENPRALLDTMCSLKLALVRGGFPIHSVVHWIPDSPLRHPRAADLASVAADEREGCRSTVSGGTNDPQETFSYGGWGRASKHQSIK